MERGFRFIEHTADVGIEIVAGSLEEVYETAGRALFHLIAPQTAEPTVARTVETEGDEPPVLLVNFLNDLLALFEVEGLLFRKLRVRSLESGLLSADTLCERLDLENGPARVDTVVKAATYHDVQVEQDGSLWRAVVYLDL